MRHQRLRGTISPILFVAAISMLLFPKHSKHPKEKTKRAKERRRKKKKPI
jgi:hypothetical protein